MSTLPERTPSNQAANLQKATTYRRTLTQLIEEHGDVSTLEHHIQHMLEHQAFPVRDTLSWRLNIHVDNSKELLDQCSKFLDIDPSTLNEAMYHTYIDECRRLIERVYQSFVGYVQLVNRASIEQHYAELNDLLHRLNTASNELREIHIVSLITKESFSCSEDTKIDLNKWDRQYWDLREKIHEYHNCITSSTQLVNEDGQMRHRRHLVSQLEKEIQSLGDKLAYIITSVRLYSRLDKFY